MISTKSSPFIKTATILIGKCVDVCRTQGVEVVVRLRELDENLLMYFPERYTVRAYDVNEQCKAGDIILIKKLPTPMTRKITHEVIKIVYPLGNVMDPISGKEVVGDKYKEHMIETDEMFNKNKTGGFTNYLLHKKSKKNEGKEGSDRLHSSTK